MINAGIRLPSAIAERPAALFAGSLMEVDDLGGPRVGLLDLPGMRPAVAMHRMVDARPITLEMKALALEDQVAVPDAVGERHERKSRSVVAFARGDIRRRHGAQQIDAVDREACHGAAGQRGQIEGETACPQRQKRHRLASSTVARLLQGAVGRGTTCTTISWANGN